MIRVCALADAINGRHQEMFLAYERSLCLAGIRYEFCIDGRPWLWKQKVEWELEMSLRHPKDHFVFTDAFDFLFVGTKEELDEAVLPYDLILTTDREDVNGCPWPKPGLKSDYDLIRKATSPWCFINGSGPAGTGEAIAKAIQFGFNSFPFPEWATDQMFWTQLYLRGYSCELDMDCSITQSLYNRKDNELGIVGDRFTNGITGKKPQFIHATGHSWPEIPKQLIPSLNWVKPK